MNNYQAQNAQLYCCQLCSAEYNTEDRQPKDLGCGHSICLPCLKNISPKTGFRCAPCGQERFFAKGVEKTPTNIPLMKIVAARNEQKKGICSQHVNYFKDCVCLEHKCQVCLYCVVYGDHKGHKTSSITEVDEEVNRKVKILEDQLNDFDHSSRYVTNYLKKDRKDLHQKVNNTFETIAKVLNSRRDEILRDVDQIYKHRATKKIKTECLNINIELAESMEKTIMDLRSEEFNEPFFMALEAEEVKMPLTPLKEEYSLLKSECQDFGSYLAGDLQQHCKAVMEKILEIEPLKIDFEPLSPLRELADELEPIPEPTMPLEECQTVPSAEPSTQQAQTIQQTHPPQPPQSGTTAVETAAEIKESSKRSSPQQPTQKQKTPSLPLSDGTNSQNAPVQRRRIKIHVQTPSKYLEIIADVNDTVKRIKNTLEKNEGISAAMEIVYQKRILDESMTILACEIKPDAVLYFGSKEWISDLRI